MVIITGTSRGIGFALAQRYLDMGETVIGIGRTTSIQHPKYQHLFCDLAQLDAVKNVQFPEMQSPVIFIHNAGTLGEINRFSDQNTSNLLEVLTVNFIAGTVLTHQLLAAIPITHEFKVAFISSGAGKRPIPSWSAYCASKAAVDLWLETIDLEEREKGRQHFQCYAIAPGVVDTAMQTTIRATDGHRFSRLANFQQLKDNNALSDPTDIAQKIQTILQIPLPVQVNWNIRELTD